MSYSNTPALGVDLSPEFPSFESQMKAVQQSIDALLQHLVWQPDADVRRELFTYLLGHTLFLIGEERGVREPSETMRLLANLLVQQSRKDVDYDDYLKTDHWRKTRMAALYRADHRCQLCHSNERLEVHHNSYSRLWNERPADLVVLCRSCHQRFHGVTDDD